MYITVQEVRDAGLLITTGAISDVDVRKKINDAEAYVNMCLAKLYQTPVTPLLNPVGTVTVSSSAKTITGSSTLFETNNDLFSSNHIYIVDSREVAVIDAVTSDTAATALDNFATAASGSEYYVIPEEICVACKFLAVKLIYEWKFSEQAFNQNTDNASNNYENFARSILKQLEGQKYYNASLTPQLATQNPARAIGVYDSLNQQNSQDIIDQYASWWT